MAHKPVEALFDVKSPHILKELFTVANVARTIKRMYAWQDGENEVTHPLRRPILLEYQDELASGLASAVASGTWHPSAAYVTLVAKRSGTYRELVFPGLIDAIIGRRVIDALEPHITADDNDKVFCGRSHANADRQRGDYENWFQVWLDFGAKIGQALERDGFTYVFDTDVTDFFPSVQRERAKHQLAQRTQAHQSLLELLFYCLETWSPRLQYCAVPGLPVEPNDVSRLVAHNYIKGVDERFVPNDDIVYLRWVDDTVIFVPDERKAHDVKRMHHLALREMGLSPNASKTQIISARAYGAERHAEFNQRVTDAKNQNDKAALGTLVGEWFSRDPQATPNWGKVATRLYTTARTLRSDCLRGRAVDDIAAHPRLQYHAFRYLLDYELTDAQMKSLLELSAGLVTSVETRMEVARFLCDAHIGGDRAALVNSAIGEVMRDDLRQGSGYAKALFLLCINKHGSRKERDRVHNWVSVDRLQDDQLRLHYLYVSYCRQELDPKMLAALRHLHTPDLALLMRICADARRGVLANHKRCLHLCFPERRGVRSIPGRYLPFLSVLLQAEPQRAENCAWLEWALSPKVASNVKDPYILEILREEHRILTR